MEVIDQNQVQGRVVDLHDAEWVCHFGEMASRASRSRKPTSNARARPTGAGVSFRKWGVGLPKGIPLPDWRSPGRQAVKVLERSFLGGTQPHRLGGTETRRANGLATRQGRSPLGSDRFEVHLRGRGYMYCAIRSSCSKQGQITGRSGTDQKQIKGRSKADQKRAISGSENSPSRSDVHGVLLISYFGHGGYSVVDIPPDHDTCALRRFWP